MSALGTKMRKTADGRLSFWCPGCDHPHQVGIEPPATVIWSWDGNVEAPTFAPSVLVTWREPAASGNRELLYEQIAKAESEGGRVPMVDCRCHSFVRNGRIEFLGDCTHALAGQTVDMPAWPHTDWSD